MRHLQPRAKLSTMARQFLRNRSLMVHPRHQDIFKGSSRFQQQMVVTWRHKWVA